MAAGTVTWSVCQVVTGLSSMWKVSVGKYGSANMYEHSIAFNILQSIAFFVCLYK